MLRHDLNSALKRLCACYAKTLSQDELDAYWAILGHLDTDALDHGIRQAMGSDRAYMPRPGQILKLSGESPKGAKSWAANGAGSSPGDPDRARRLGEWSVTCADPTRRTYFRTLVDHMAGRDLEVARKAADQAGRQGDVPVSDDYRPALSTAFEDIRRELAAGRGREG